MGAVPVAEPDLPAADRGTLFAGPGRVVFLERPSHRGNVGAAVRVAAAAGAAGVLTSGSLDPWHPHALRGAAAIPMRPGGSSLDLAAATASRATQRRPRRPPRR